MLWWRTRYHLWTRWKNGSLLDRGDVGDYDKVYFPLESGDGGPSGESMWAEKLDRGLYRLDNNGFFAKVSRGDVVRVRVKWPILEVVEVVDRKRRTVRISFELPWPNRAERQTIREAVEPQDGEIEWAQPNLLTISFPKGKDPYALLEGVLGENARILEVDSTG
ncbi:DUF4265 domain-containing protein [Micromonospora maritima]|uniref:DUF4265 domain-containing protein n=1 Tax=Micromonospora maritima TaxID=986711 RepID=UPI00157CD00C|nr:DUF4265 domain-containing protein [Micromonospora maritima]